MLRVYAACRANGDLRAALTRLVEAGEGRRPGGARAQDRRALRRFFEYCYFGSDEFLRWVG
jgi:hypothetical protein